MSGRSLQFRSDDGLNDRPIGHSNGPNSEQLPITEAYSAVATITPTDTVPNPVVALGRNLAVNCTVAGNVKVGFMDGSTMTFPVAAGFTIFPFRIAQVFVTGTTATATYTGLK